MDIVDPADVAPDRGARASRIDVRRSRRRRRTVSAYRDGDTTVVLIPASLSKTEEQQWVATMVARLDRADRRRRPGDADLTTRAAELSRAYLDDRVRPTSVRWVSNQHSRWGSCTPADATIRLSDRLRGLPSYVVDYVLLHELAHLIEPRHGSRFWRLLDGFERLERARGFLEGVAASTGDRFPPDVDEHAEAAPVVVFNQPGTLDLDGVTPA